MRYMRCANGSKWRQSESSCWRLPSLLAPVTFGSVRFLLDLSKRATDPYSPYKDLIGRSLLLGLQFLVAADVIRTVALELTPRNIGMLGALVVIRTFLSWSVVVETEGHWPWQTRPRGRSE